MTQVHDVHFHTNVVLQRELDDRKLNKLRWSRHQKRHWKFLNKDVVAMLWCGDEPSGEIKSMKGWEIYSANKKFRQEFIDSDGSGRMMEWKWNKSRDSDGRLHKRRNGRNIDLAVKGRTIR